jgi:hypothetical protein
VRRRTKPISRLGRVAEWFKAPVLKTGVPARVPWVRIPPLPPHRYKAGNADSRRFLTFLGHQRPQQGAFRPHDAARVFRDLDALGERPDAHDAKARRPLGVHEQVNLLQP